MTQALQEEMLSLMPRLRRFALSLTGSGADADDLLQTTYEKAISGIASWEEGTRLDAWMFKIARNSFLNQMRAGAVRRNAAPRLAAEQPSNHDGARLAEDRLTLEAVRGLIDRLPEEQRSILLLVAVEGLSYQEVAGMMELPAGTVASRLGRARQTLRDWLGGRDIPIGGAPLHLVPKGALS